MGKNIVLLSDGTGNSSSKLFKTNVWRLYEALDLSDPQSQIAYYDDGVGTSSFKLFAILGGVFGFGLKRNVIDIYSFCCRNYADGDRIYGFGFSRGAFTMRLVAGLIAREGLVPYDGNEADLARHAASAYRDYRKRFNSTKGLVDFFRYVRDQVVTAYRAAIRVKQYDKSQQTEVPAIRFMGLWDTVDAYGGPIEEITRAIDYWYWPLSMPDRFMNAKVHRACHALALEDERDAFRPVIWDERYTRRADQKLHAIDFGWQPDVEPEWETKLKPIDRQRLSQVWFVGVHSDVGGGYPQDGLAHVTLDWMIDRAEPYGLKINALRRADLETHIDPYDKLNNSREGFAGYYRYKPRKISEIYAAPPYKPSISKDLEYMRGELSGKRNTQSEVVEELAEGTPYVEPPDPTIHISVFERIEATLKPAPPPPFKIGTDGYVPIVLPVTYRVTDRAGNISAYDPFAQRQAPTSAEIHKVWNLVWARRVVYFLTVFASVALLAVPLLDQPTFGADSPLALLKPLINLVEAFLPSMLSPWFEAYRAAPGLLALGGGAVLALLWIGSALQDNIRDVMRAVWLRRPVATGRADEVTLAIRSAPGYRIFFYALKHWFLPSIFALLILFCIVAALVQIVYRTADSLGAICRNAPPAAGTSATSAEFNTSSSCTATGVQVLKGQDYRVTFTVNSAWKDRGIPSSPQGTLRKDTPRYMTLFVPFRRLLTTGWFTPVIRVGSRGADEYPLIARPNPPGNDKVYQAIFRPTRSGNLFVYVNDVWFTYGNNEGSAVVTIERLDPVR